MRDNQQQLASSGRRESDECGPFPKRGGEELCEKRE